MGSVLGRLEDALFQLRTRGKDTRILMLGLDNSGKTAILYKVKLDEDVISMPTIGYNVETLTPVKGVTFTVTDAGGQQKLRHLWKFYFTATQGLLYIVDSADAKRLDDAKEELFNIIGNDGMRGVPVVVLANKQDLPGALTASEVARRMGLVDGVLDRKWHVQGACAKTGDGLCEGMTVLARLVKEFNKNKNKNYKK